MVVLSSYIVIKNFTEKSFLSKLRYIKRSVQNGTLVLINLLYYFENPQSVRIPKMTLLVFEGTQLNM